MNWHGFLLTIYVNNFSNRFADIIKQIIKTKYYEKDIPNNSAANNTGGL